MKFYVIFTVFAAFTVPKVYGVKCYMCNALMMSPFAAPCPDGPASHPMDCGDMTKYCLKWDGMYSVTNTTDRKTVTHNGVYRDCGMDEWLKAFLGSVPTDSGACSSVDFANREVEKSGLQISLIGTVCTCSSENCNGAIQKSTGIILLLSSLLIALFYTFL